MSSPVGSVNALREEVGRPLAGRRPPFMPSSSVVRIAWNRSSVTRERDVTSR
jgi:hypothetical protein